MLLVLLAIPAAVVNDRVGEPNLRVDGSISANAEDIIEKQFGSSSSVAILLTGPDREVEKQGHALETALRTQGIGDVVAPWTQGGPGAALRPDSASALLLVLPNPSGGDMAEAAHVRAVVDQSIGAPVDAALTGNGIVGDALQKAGVRELRRGELLALPLLLIILLLVFRSLGAALVPIAVGGTVLVATTGLLSISTEFLEIDTLGVSIGSMMSLALGVDYSLLIVSRFREELEAGHDSWTAAATARRTAGRTVIVAGGVLLAAVGSALIVAPGPFLVSATVAVGLAAVCGVAFSVALVPIILGFMGARINGRRGRGASDADGWVVRACRMSMRRPIPVGVLVLLVLAGLSVPALSMRAGTPGVELLTADDPALAEYRTIAERMGPGWSAPFVVIADRERGPVTTKQQLDEIAAFQNRLTATPGVAAVLGPGPITERLKALDQIDGPALASAATQRGVDIGAMVSDAPGFLRSGYLRLAALDGANPSLRQSVSSVVNIDRGATAVRFLVIPDGPAGGATASALAEDLSRQAAEFAAQSQLRVAVGGPGQLVLDFGSEIKRLVPILLLVLTVSSFLVLAILLRTVVLPLVAVALNVLTVGTSFGVLALLYDGSTESNGIPSYIAGTAVLGIMGIMFGLSIDYQVFMLERIREAWQQSRDAISAIHAGIVGTARVITGAALVMLAVFVGFALTDFPVNRQLGIGLIVAVVVDATLVRLLLLPGALRILGAHAWWPMKSASVVDTESVESDQISADAVPVG
ncbi:MMPL family transporter [Nocardia tengchongensis]|uniref:MMPL family transporter n=1 Tax=Nocardia tengchongensis TaxID=2055889 RepID=UPI00367FBF81